MRDYVIPRTSWGEGEHVEELRYGYRKLDGEMVRDNWVIACDKPGAIGPFTKSRRIVVGRWVMDKNDQRRNDLPKQLRCNECDGIGITLNSRTAPPRNGGIPDGRLSLGETHVVFYLACDECSATPRTTDSLTEAYLWLTEYDNVRVVG